ncbi:MAG: hypothetical protein IPI46_10870 [Bacteroidetes bacterium]|nr:hypothetical protein [Bacteroidota bacterium]
MRKLLFVILILLAQHAMAVDDSKLLIREINRKFALVADYNANVDMKFDIPGVKMNSMKGKIFFKKPDRFRIRTKGIYFMPKQNPMQQIGSMLLDTNSYTSIISGYETLDGRECAVVNIIPTGNQSELILGKFWIDKKNPLIMKTQITTRNNGTIETQNVYGSMAKYALPEKITIVVEMKRFKMSKMMTADLNKKSAPKKTENQTEKGRISMTMSNYKINTKFSDAEFTAE